MSEKKKKPECLNMNCYLLHKHLTQRHLGSCFAGFSHSGTHKITGPMSPRFPNISYTGSRTGCQPYGADCSNIQNVKIIG